MDNRYEGVNEMKIRSKQNLSNCRARKGKDSFGAKIFKVYSAER